MTKIRFNTDQISLPEIVAFFAEYMIIAKPTTIKNGTIELGALVFYPDGIMRTTVSLENIVLQRMLEEYHKAGYEYEIL